MVMKRGNASETQSSLPGLGWTAQQSSSNHSNQQAQTDKSVKESGARIEPEALPLRVTKDNDEKHLDSQNIRNQKLAILRTQGRESAKTEHTGVNDGLPHKNLVTSIPEDLPHDLPGLDLSAIGDDVTEDGEAIEGQLFEHIGLRDLNQRLSRIREADPQDYFKGYRSAKTKHAQSVATRHVQFSDLPFRLQKTLREIRLMDITTAEEAILTKVMKKVPGYGTGTEKDPYKEVRLFLQKVELRRAVFFSSWWREQMEADLELLMNVWGLEKDHVATCLVVPNKYAAWFPENLISKLQNDVMTLKVNYLPISTSRGPGNGISRLTSNFKLSDEVSGKRASTTGTIFVRLLAWCNWKHTVSLQKAESELTYIPRKTMTGSHTCGQGYCLIHCVFESYDLNIDRDGCQSAARRLRRKGEAIPQFCTDHTPPCLMQLQALSPIEALNVQMSISRGEAKHWFDEVTKLVDFPTRECSFPLSYVTEVPGDDYGEVKHYSGPALDSPPGFIMRVKCGLCSTSFSCFNTDFYRHCRAEHSQDQGFLDALKAHRQAWVEQAKAEKKKRPRYRDLDKLLLPNVTVEKALEILETCLKSCAICSASQVKPYAKNAWTHLLKHSEEDLFLEAGIEKARDWLKGMKPKIPKTKCFAFCENVLKPGVTKPELVRLLQDFTAQPKKGKSIKKLPPRSTANSLKSKTIKTGEQTTLKGFVARYKRKRDDEVVVTMPKRKKGDYGDDLVGGDLAEDEEYLDDDEDDEDEGGEYLNGGDSDGEAIRMERRFGWRRK